MRGAASPPHAVPNGRCASPPRRLPSTPLLTGLPPRFFRHWRRSALPPWPAFKKAGENWLENFSGVPENYAGPPLIGSGGLGFFIGSRGGKGWWMDRLGRWKFQRTGGGGGRARSALKERARGLWPRPRSFVWQAEGRPAGPPLGRQTPPPPLRPSEKGAAAAGCGPGGWAGKRYGFTAAWNAARSASASSVGSYR